MLTMQMIHFSLEREIDRAEKAAIQGRQESKRERVREWEEQRREREERNGERRGDNSLMLPYPLVY